MANPTDAFTKNSFVDRCLKLVPDDPLMQAQYMYYLTCVVFFGILGYGVVSWYGFATTLSLKSFFSACFMTAIALISLFGLKQTRNAYKALKAVYAMKRDEKIESKEEMLKLFGVTNK